jgi:hypothetical protein
MKCPAIFLIGLAAFFSRASAETVDTDLLIVGGDESACAAAVQAARLGVKRIVLVNDIDWLGGQFSAEGVGCPDEWTGVNGKRVNFPRSGLFREVVDRIRAHNSRVYGLPSPGNSYCGTETIEPAAAEKIFEELLAPYADRNGGPLQILRGWQPTKVIVEDNRVTSVEFENTNAGSGKFTVNARLTMDASDWGDVIRLSGAKYSAGPDLRSRFGEPSAPEKFDDAGAQEMNPLSWCLVLRETGGQDATILRPATYDARSFTALDGTPPWVESDMSAGIYSQSGWSIYTHRRLVDRWHNGFAPGTEALFLNWPVQDYPLCQLPQRVIDALEKTEPGASKKNIVDLTPVQRRFIFEDAKQHALGMLYHLQTKVHDRVGDFPQSFRYMKLTEEFGTADHLPPKPYVREGLRLEALYMLREQDIRAATREPRWAKFQPLDGVFGFQFNIDFHPTRRKFLTGNRNGPWQYVHTESRSWHTDTDRAMFPIRGLVPVERDGLLGCGKNIGVSSIVQSALRLHGQMMLVGQASATLAWLSLRDHASPHSVALSPLKVRELQQTLLRGHGGPPVLIFPWQDTPLEAPWYEAAQMLALRGIWQPDSESVFFSPEKTLTRRELARLLVHFSHEPHPLLPASSRFTDVPVSDPDRSDIETMMSRGNFGTPDKAFHPDEPCTHATLQRWLKALNLPVSRDVLSSDQTKNPLIRAEAARFLWDLFQHVEGA